MRAALFVALWVTVSVPLAFAVGAIFRGLRASELAEQVDAYLRRLAAGRGVTRARHTTRIVLVCAGLVVLAAGSLRFVSDVPQRIITAGIRNADFFGPGPGSGATSRAVTIDDGDDDAVAAAAPATARPLTDVFGEPLTADDLGVPVPGAFPATPAQRADGAPSSTAEAAGSEDPDSPSREPATIAETGDGEPVSEPENDGVDGPDDDGGDRSSGSSPSGSSPTTTAPSTTSTTTPPAATTTTTTSTTTTTTTTTSTTTVPDETTTTTSTTSTTTVPDETTTTTSTTSTTTPPDETTTTTTVSAQSQPSGDDASNGNGMGSIDHEPAAVESDEAADASVDGSSGGDVDGDADPGTSSTKVTYDSPIALDAPVATEPEAPAMAEPAADSTGDA